MIIEIDGHFFNPLQVQLLYQDREDVKMYFNEGLFIRFKEWTCYNLAARINELIEEFNKK